MHVHCMCETCVCGEQAVHDIYYVACVHFICSEKSRLQKNLKERERVQLKKDSLRKVCLN